MKNLILFLLALAIFGQGTPHVVYGTLRDSDGYVPDIECIRYSVATTEGDSIYYTIEHTSATECTLTTGGIWAAQVAGLHVFTGDSLLFTFEDVCDGCEDKQVSLWVVIDDTPVQNEGIVSLPECLWIKEGESIISDNVTISAIYDISGKRFKYNSYNDFVHEAKSGMYIVEYRYRVWNLDNNLRAYPSDKVKCQKINIVK